MRLLKQIGLWILTILMLLVLIPVIYADAWVERRAKRRKFNG